MASVTLKSSDTFPAGTAVAAYPVVNWPQEAVPPAGAPRGSSVASGTVAADGSVALTGLTDDVRYFLAGQVGGVWRYVRFSAAVPSVVAKYAMAGTFTALQNLAAGATLGDGLGVTGVARVRIPTALASRAPSGIDYWEQDFSGTKDPILWFGYGHAGGVLSTAGEPGIAFGVEGNYNDGSGANKQEAYVSCLRAAGGGLYDRPLMIVKNRTTDAIATSLSGTSVTLGQAKSDGSGGADAILTATANQVLVSAIGTADDTVLRVKAATGRASILSLGRAAVDDVVTLKPGTATRLDITFTVETATPVARIYAKPGGGAAGGSIAVGGVDDNSAVGVFAVNTSGIATKGVVARARAGQTGNLFEAQASDGTTIYSTFSENGYFTTLKAAAPADAELAASEMALWFDATNGAAKLMVKAKQADGTVRTGSLALA